MSEQYVELPGRWYEYLLSLGISSEVAIESEKVIIARHREELSATKEKLKAAEQRIRESQEQEPIAYVYKMFGEDGPMSYWPGSEPPNNVTATVTSIYTMPPIPPELAELQRENAELRKQLESGMDQNKELWNLVEKLKSTPKP